MKKILTKIISAAVCAGLVLSTAMSAAAETIIVEPQYPLHGNKCCDVFITPEIDRVIYVKITQITNEGDYVYYDTVIPAGGEATGENDYDIVLEGKDDTSYKMVLGVPKYKGSKDTQEFTYEFSAKDPDFNPDEETEGYVYYVSVQRNDELEQPELTSSDVIFTLLAISKLPVTSFVTPFTKNVALLFNCSPFASSFTRTILYEPSPNFSNFNFSKSSSSCCPG